MLKHIDIEVFADPVKAPPPVTAFGPYAQEPPPPQAPSPNLGAHYHPNPQPNTQYYPPNNTFQSPPQNLYQSPVNDGSYHGGFAPQTQRQGQGVTEATHSQWFPPPDGRDHPTNYPGTPGYEPPRQGYNVSTPQPRENWVRRLRRLVSHHENIANMV